MKHWIRAVAFVIAAGIVTATVPRVYAQQHATSDEAIALVKKAVSYLKANGPEKAFAAFADPNGGFIKGELYVVCLDQKGTVLSHPNPKMVGQNNWDMVDPDGKPFTQQNIAKANAGGGWVEYKFSHPVTHKLAQKSMYVEKGAGDVVVGAGIYK
jgi:cytochrome c